MNNNKQILVFCGLMGSGKTTLSNTVLNKLRDYTRFNTDDVRREMGITIFDRKDTPRVNEYMYSRAKMLLKEGKGVIFDSAYKLKEAREKIYSIGQEFNVPVIIVECVCSSETSINRISVRKKDDLHSPTNSAEVYREYAKIWESPELDISEHNISLLNADTDSNKVKIVKVGKGHELAVEKILVIIRKVLSKF